MSFRLCYFGMCGDAETRREMAKKLLSFDMRLFLAQKRAPSTSKLWNACTKNAIAAKSLAQVKLALTGSLARQSSRENFSAS